MGSDSKNLVHWADHTADRIIRQKGDKDKYVVASGITPSGVVHFGNFREVMTVALVAQGLRDRGKEVRFIFSWDDYDTFRKIPKNMPQQEELEKYLFQPIVDTPDPFGKEKSYAAHHQQNFENELKRVGIESEFIYQNTKYRAGDYSEEIKKALDNAADIKKILDEHRSSPLPENFLPVSVYCEKCNTDHKIVDKKYSTDSLTYKCENCGHTGEEKFADTSRLKLPWRADWPMRWAYEKVDFEPGGKDHSSQGGSRTTGQEIVKLFGGEAPVYLQYDFVAIKGGGGKMSSSSGEVITLTDVLNVYEPEMVRWIFASYKSNVDFSVSFDLDIIKNYEDFDRMERLAYGVDSGNEKKVNMAKRVYELSQINGRPAEMPFQPSFRHLTNILQIHDLNIEAARKVYAGEIKNERDERRFIERARAAVFWLQNYAPEEFKFGLNKKAPQLSLNETQKSFLNKLNTFLKDSWSDLETDKALHEKMYEFIHEVELSPGDVFPSIYQLLISKEKGPKLAGFIRTIGKERTTELFDSALK